MLDELAEWLAGWALLFKKHVGVFPYAMSLQNEPLFKEPYAACVYDAPLYRDALKKVRARLDSEGAGEVKMFGHEDVFETGAVMRNKQWLETIAADPQAKSALYAFALHNYFSNGVTPTDPDARTWQSAAALAKNILGLEKTWMTESTCSADPFKAANALYLGIKYGRIAGWTWFYYANCLIDFNGNLSNGAYGYKQFARFVRPGTDHVQSNCTDAGLLPSWEVFRTGGSDKCASIGTHQTSTPISLPARSVTTLVSGRYKGTADGVITGGTTEAKPAQRAKSFYVDPAFNSPIRSIDLFPQNGTRIARFTAEETDLFLRGSALNKSSNPSTVVRLNYANGTTVVKTGLNATR